MPDKTFSQTDPEHADNESPSFLGPDGSPTETIDFRSVFAEYSAAIAATDPEKIAGTSVGKLLQALPVPALLIDPFGNIFFANRAWAQLGGPEGKNLLGVTFSSFFQDAKIARKADNLIEKVVRERKPHVVEGELRFDETAVWGRMHLRSIRIGKDRSVLLIVEDYAPDRYQLAARRRGRVPSHITPETGFSATGHETVVLPISTGKKTSDAYALGAARPVGISYFEEGTLKWTNQAMMNLFGDVSETEWADRQIRDFYPSDEEHDRVKEIMKEGLAKGKPVETEAVFRRNDGSQFQGRIKVSAVDPKVPGKGTVVTITPKDTESAQHTAASQVPGDGSGGLVESEQLYRALLEYSPMGIVVCDTAGNVVEVNQKALKQLGSSHVEAVKGLNLLTFPPMVETGVSSVIGNCLKAGKPVVSEFPNRIGLGRKRHTRLHVAPIRDSRGTFSGVQVMIEDISDLKASEQKLLQSERLKAVGEMSGAVAHSFNNLLQFVAGGSRKALGCLESRDYSQMRPLLEQIFDGTRKAVLTVRRLQQFARARRAPGVSQFSSAQKEVFDLSETVREGIEKSKIRSKLRSTPSGIEISLDTQLKEGCFVEGEEAELIEVVVNLLNNAVEALPVGGVIKVRTDRQGDQATLEIEDNGVGIPASNLGRIFEPFWSTKEDHDGMGLTANFGIVRRHRGTITVASSKGRGATFSVKLPGAAVAQEKPAPVEAEGPTHSFRVLLIDDDEPIVRIFEKGLNKLGQSPIAALSGLEGLKIFEENEVDAVVCDLAMPGMNGWEVARAIHQICLERGVPKPPFILLTGWAGQLGEEEILAHPDVDRIIEKPVKSARLLDIIAREIKGASEDTTLGGRVVGIDPVEYIQVLMLTGKPVVVEILHRNGVRGLVYLAKGQILHSTCGDLQGEEALFRCLNWKGGSIANLPWREPEKYTIEKPAEYLLVEACRRRDETRLSS